VVASAGWAAATDGLATVGLVPAAPVTAFGYIEVASARDAQDWRRPEGTPPAISAAAAALPAFESAGFKEKPSADVAQRYVADGRHLWNLGLFAWTARRFRSELTAAHPELAATIDRSTWNIPPIFAALQKVGGIHLEEMWRTFNMGVGMVVIVPPDVPAIAEAAGIPVWRIGEVVEQTGTRRVVLT